MVYCTCREKEVVVQGLCGVVKSRRNAFLVMEMG